MQKERDRLSPNWTGCSCPGSSSSQSMASQVSALCQPSVSTVRLILGHAGRKRTDFWGWPEAHIHRDCMKKKGELKRSCSNNSRSNRLEQVQQTFSVKGREDMLRLWGHAGSVTAVQLGQMAGKPCCRFKAGFCSAPKVGYERGHSGRRAGWQPTPRT